MTTVDLALCGGGLQNALIVAALHGHRAAPGALAWRRLALVEQETVGGNHTWCFYGGDLSPAMQRWVGAFVAHGWSSYEVRFPGYRRVLATPYFMISSPRLRSAVRSMLDARGALLWERAPVHRLESTTLHLSHGRRLQARMVVDARGARPPGTECGYQKFYGREVTLRAPHGLTRPIVMDATVDQYDGFRFMYVLPLGERRALLEDTTFSDGPELDLEQRREGIAAWLRRHGWQVETVDRTERGVLPMPLRMPPPEVADSSVVHGGYGGGWFHPGTGYSLPLAAELAELVAASPPAALVAAVAQARLRLQRRARFCCLLNRLLFRGYPAPARRAVFARFFRLPEATIRRLFRMRLNRRDKIRILGGRPPPGLSLRQWRTWNRSRRIPQAACAAGSDPARSGGGAVAGGSDGAGEAAAAHGIAAAERTADAERNTADGAGAADGIAAARGTDAADGTAGGNIAGVAAAAAGTTAAEGTDAEGSR